jgi:hypothetical protein
MVMGITQWRFLADLSMTVSPIYFISSGFIWAVIGIILCIGLWLGRFWAVSVTRWAAISFTVYYWADQLLVMDNPLRSTNWPFLITFNLIILVIITSFFTLPKVNRFFGEKYEREPEDPRVT